MHFSHPTSNNILYNFYDDSTSYAAMMIVQVTQAINPERTVEHQARTPLEHQQP